MRKVSHILGAMVLSAGTAFAADTPAQRLDLSDSVNRALQNNQRLLSAREDIRVAEQRLREVQSQYYPQVGLNLNTSRYLAEQDTVLPPEFGSILLRTSRGFEPDTFYSARAWLKQPIYSGGRTRNNIRLSRTNLETARIQHEEIRSRVVHDVTKTFYDVLLHEKEAELYAAAVRDVQPLAAGPRRADVKSIESRLSRGLSEKQRLAERARLDFLNALGLELYTRVDLTGELKPVSFNMDLAKLLTWAQESRSEIRRTDFQQEIDRLAVNMSMAERYPTVAFGAAYELNDPSFPLQTTQWSASLNVNLPVFDGFSSRARIRQRRFLANQSRIERTEIEDQVNLDVRQSHADAVYWQEERQRRERDMREAEEALSADRTRDAADRARGVLWALETREAYWQAVHGQRVSLARLQKAVGRSLAE